MSMRVKKGVLAVFFALCFLSISLAFFDDLNAYNSITDTTFKANYTTTSAGVGFFAITSDATNGIYLMGYYNVFNPTLYLFPNLSRAGSTDLPFTAGYTVLSGSVAPNRTTNGNLDLVFYFLTNAMNSTQLPTARGYVASVKINNDNGANITINLRRCVTSLNSYTSCGVLLKQESFIVDNSLLYNNNTGLIVNNSFSVNISDSVNGDISVYIAGVNRLSYTDKIYSSGNLGFYFSPLTLIAPITVIKIDNISISATIGAGVSGWSLYSFPQNIPDYLDYGQYRFVHRTFQPAPNYCLLGSNVCFTEDSLGFDITTKPLTTETTNTTYQPTCLKGYSDTNFCTIIPIQYLSSIALGINYDEGTYYLKYGNSFLNEDLRRLLGVQAYNKIQASNSGCYYYNSLYTALNGQPIPTNGSIYWGSSSIWGGYPTTRIDIYGALGFYCLSPNNITITTEIYQNGTLADTLNTILPVGCLRNSNGTVDCGSIIDCIANASLCSIIVINQPIGDLTCIVGDTRPECISQLQEPSFDTIVNALFSFTMIGLYLSIIIASIVAYYTRNAMFGAIIMMICLMIMSSVGLLNAWFMFLTIAIIALGLAGMLALKK